MRVIKSGEGSMVGPCESTPSGTLSLSLIDSQPALRYRVRSLHVFKHGPNAGAVVRAALSKALVHYYPLAGRLLESGQGLACTAQGVWFVEASASCSLEAINYLDNDDDADFTQGRFQLIPEPPPPPPLHRDGTSDPLPLVLMQVTQFTCEGFVMGLEFSHCVCDGLGAAQFLVAVGEIARGLQVPSVAPVWCREALGLTPGPHGSASDTQVPVPVPEYQLEQAHMDLSLDHIARLKKEFQDLTGGHTCSAFEALAATVWRCRARATPISVTGPHETLVFFANARGLVDPPLPQGFYGNCFFPVLVTVPRERLVSGSHVETVKLIQEAKAMLPTHFANWITNPLARSPPISYATLFVSEWGRLGFGDVDYGWGPPVHIVPVNYSNIVPVCIMGCPPLPGKGVRLMTWCVEEPHLNTFRQQLLMETQQS